MCYNLVKVFCISDMPSRVRKEFDYLNKGKELGEYMYYKVYNVKNYVDVRSYRITSKTNPLVNYALSNKEHETFEDIKRYKIGDNIIDDWLYENGADVGDEVIIRVW